MHAHTFYASTGNVNSHQYLFITNLNQIEIKIPDLKRKIAFSIYPLQKLS